MPELPEVEAARRLLEPAMRDACFDRVLVRRADLRRAFPVDFARRLTGTTVLEVDRRAKYLLLPLSSGEALLMHLGMSGDFRVMEPDGSDQQAPPPEPGKHDHVVFEMSSGQIVVFNDPRRFGTMELLSAEERQRHPTLARLGPEPLSSDFSAASLAWACAGRGVSLKVALLDQRVVAGLGNIYAVEALHRAGLSPLRAAASVTGRRAERLARAIRLTLEEAIAAGGSSLRDHRRPSGELGYFQHSFAVYDREGQACPGCDCDSAATGGIRRIIQGGRSTFYCAKRQR